jgi:glucans biosynthesis protein C
MAGAFCASRAGNAMIRAAEGDLMTALTTALDVGVPPAAVTVGAGERFHALDSLRATAMLLGIVLHAAVSLTPVPIPWPARDVSRSESFIPLAGFIHGFRMQVFFFLAGFFAHLLWRRLGTRAFLRQRALRIGAPFVAGLLVLIPAILLLWTWADSRSGGTFVAMARQQQGQAPSLLSYPTAHLWFLEMLLILYVLAVAVARLGQWRVVADCLPRIDAGFDWLMRQPLKPVMLAVPTFALLWLGPQIPEIDRAGMQLLPSMAAIAYYGLFFTVGWWMHRRLHLVDQMRNWLLPYFGLALAAFVLLGGGMKLSMSPGAAAHWTSIKFTALAAAALYSWCMTFAVTGLFLRFASGHRPWARYMADASYWWYLVHVPIVMAVQIWIADWPVNGWLKLLLILAVAGAVLLPSYHYLVRYTWIGRILNGPRLRPAA